MSGTTTNYGWTYPTSTDYVKDGATAIQTVATGIDTTLGTALNNKTHAGLVLIKTQTVGTGVSSVTVTGAFSSTYDNYKIIYAGGVAGVDGNAVNFQLTGITNNTYSYGGMYFSYAPSTVNVGSQSLTSWLFGLSGTSGQHMNMDLFSPYLAKAKFFNISSASQGYHAQYYAGNTTNTTSVTGFSLSTSTTLTGGTIAVYGYAKD